MREVQGSNPLHGRPDRHVPSNYLCVIGVFARFAVQLHGLLHSIHLYVTGIGESMILSLVLAILDLFKPSVESIRYRSVSVV